MNYRILATASSIAALAVVAVALPASAEDKSRVQINEMVPAFAESQTEADKVPNTVNLGALGDIDEGTTRSLGSDDAAEYWVARSGPSDICLVMYLGGENELSSSVCGPIADFYRTGLGLRSGVDVNDPATSAEAYFLPADVALTDIAPDNISLKSNESAPSASLLTVQPENTDLKPVKVPRADGSYFSFTPLFEGR